MPQTWANYDSFTNCGKKVNNLKQGGTFMCGDFNITLDAFVDVRGPSPRKPCQATLIPFLNANNPTAPTQELTYLWVTNNFSKMQL